MDWDHGPNAAYNSAQFKKELQQTARQPGKVMRNEGDVDTEFAKGGKTLDAEYYVPHLAHATMEPPVAVADFRDGKVSVWAPTQDPQGVGPHEGARLSVKQPPPVRRVMQGLHRAARVWSATWSFSPRRTVERPVPPPMATTFITHPLGYFPPAGRYRTRSYTMRGGPEKECVRVRGWLHKRKHPREPRRKG